MPVRPYPHNLGLKVIAESVETQAQFEYLCEQGCDQVPGFLFSKAVPAEEIEAQMQQQQASSISSN